MSLAFGVEVSFALFASAFDVSAVGVGDRLQVGIRRPEAGAWYAREDVVEVALERVRLVHLRRPLGRIAGEQQFSFERPHV